MTSVSKELGLVRLLKHPLQITTRTLKEPDFKFELLPLRSPLLRQSLLVSFPPLIDMLKFSGYSYLIRGIKIQRQIVFSIMPQTKDEKRNAISKTFGFSVFRCRSCLGHLQPKL